MKNTAGVFVRPDQATVNATLELKNARDVDVVLFDDSGVKVLQRKRLNGSEQAINLTLPNPPAGPHSVTVAAFQGNTRLKVDESAKQLSFTVLSAGPEVDHIDLDRLTQDPNGKTFTVHFKAGHPLDTGLAQDPQSYGLSTSTPGVTAPTLAQSSTITYDISANAVTFVLNTALPPGAYEFVVKDFSLANANKGIKGVLEHPLNAPATVGGPAAGRSHSVKFVKAVGPTGDAPPISPVAGLRDTKAEYIRYGEYTDPRKLPPGFNPSDKVITRVARLYYFRDAHRVAQIINRKAKSYNRQAVDMKQQLADNARGQADVATDDRKRLEANAVRLAQQAREAENTLRQQQQALIQARRQQEAAAQTLERSTNDLADANARLDDLSAALSQHQSELTAAKDAKTKLPADASAEEKMKADAAVEQAQEKVDADNMQIAAQKDSIRRMQQAQSSLQTQVTSANGQVDMLETRVRQLLGEVQAKRDAEIKATERWEDADRVEQRKREDQFRREVAAKMEDPDTFAPGYPQSEDPVEQVSVSVVGEGLIQLRGPRKGVNLVHTMINELDAPVGQVRVAVHTVQINGEHGERMEKVAQRIQRYIDHARFLTAQSAQYLRNAVVIVATRKAEEANAAYGDCPPDVRAQKYREAFFGKDFLDELGELDSEFLRADNKVLSLHSMDTTSLASALFLLALAKNDTREEILQKFEELVQCHLPHDEKEYFKASAAKKWVNFKPFHFSADNARFVSLRGCFAQHETGLPDTLNPGQREFIRLAQIFKARLVTEIEWRQRVMERALIEERLPNMQELQTDALRKEQLSRQAMEDAVQRRESLRLQLVAALDAAIHTIRDQIEPQGTAAPIYAAIGNSKTGRLAPLYEIATGPRQILLGGTTFDISVDPASNSYVVSPSTTNDIVKKTLEGADFAVSPAERQKTDFDRQWNEMIDRTLRSNRRMLRLIDSMKLGLEYQSAITTERDFLAEIQSQTKDLASPNRRRVKTLYVLAVGEQRLRHLVHIGLDNREALARSVASAMLRPDTTPLQMQSELTRLKSDILTLDVDPSVGEQILKTIRTDIRPLFDDLVRADAQVAAAKQAADSSRRPLDHKKFLDMLVDDVEEKLIELIEGTRAHTANVDNYVKRIATALEDDFNTQFYYPAFRYVRETSQYWDVQVGQVETTSILANNRAFAKVSPQATMEFDLPKRDILINEAFNSALAAYNDYGALLADPQFLALAKMYGGQPASQTYGGGLPAPMVRDVLPGLPSQTDAQYLSQAENNVPKLGANLEALIPDPAVYKFETGTGYEVRPVIQPDGQAVVFHLNYMYTTNIREPVRADEKHLGRIKRHFIDTDVQLGNYELREVSRYTVALKASRTARGVPLLEDVPVAGALFRPLPQQESSLQQNLILAQSVIYPTLFDLMGLRWAPAVADLGTTTLQEREFVTRNREKFLRNEVFDYSSLQVDDFMRVPEGDRRGDLYRTQEAIPLEHPNGYFGKGLNLHQGELREGYDPRLHDRGTPSSSVPPIFQEGGVSQPVQSPSSGGEHSALPPRPTEIHSGDAPRPAGPAAPRTSQDLGPLLEVPQSSTRGGREPSGIVPAKAEMPAPRRSVAPAPPPSRPRGSAPKSSPAPAAPQKLPTTSATGSPAPAIEPVRRQQPVDIEAPVQRTRTWLPFGRKSEAK